MIVLLESGMEILFDYKKLKTLSLVDWFCSWLYVNEPKYFYLGLTIIGLSVTMQKKVKVKIPNTI